MSANVNHDIAGLLEEVARILAEQGAIRYRVDAYRHAAETLRTLPRSVADIYATEGLSGLIALPHIGQSIAYSIRDVLQHGRLAMLERIRGESDPIAQLTSVPGIGVAMAHRLHEELGLGSLQDLEAAAHDGRLENFAGIGAKRLAGIRDSLAHRLGRVRPPASASPAMAEPGVAELLDVDREYREQAAAGKLKLIAPRRFNPEGKAWLPVLHTQRGERHYTALFSNTERAHHFGRTHDWVVLFFDGDHQEHQHTVITSERGSMKGRRIVRGREAECAEFYERQNDLFASTATDRSSS